MKRYIDKDGNFWDGTSIVLDDMRIFNPTDEQMIAAGYTEYVEPEPTPEELLERAKQQKLFEIDEYNLSEAVDSFFLGEQQMWLTRDERTQIDESINAYEAMGATEMTKYFGGVAYTFPLILWKQMLNTLIVYASEALNVTEMHKVAVNALETVEAVENYDITADYPEKPAFPASV